MKKIRIRFILGILLLITGLIILNFAGHRHMSKGFILTVIGFIFTGASGITLLQIRKMKTKNKSTEIIDQD